jgi:hypothetical protein
VRRTERNRLRRVADKQILIVAIEHSQIGFRKFRGLRPLFLMQKSHRGGRGANLSGMITPAATNNGGTS